MRGFLVVVPEEWDETRDALSSSLTHTRQLNGGVRGKNPESIWLTGREMVGFDSVGLGCRWMDGVGAQLEV